MMRTFLITFVIIIAFALSTGCVGPNNDKIFIEKVSLSMNEVTTMIATISDIEQNKDAAGLNQAATAMSKRMDVILTELKDSRVSQKMEPVKAEVILAFSSFKKAFDEKAKAGNFFQNNDSDNGIRANNLADQYLTEGFAHFDLSDTLLGNLKK